MIPVTKPFLPPLDEFKFYLDRIWEHGWLTNNGPMIRELELELKEFLKVDDLLLVGNGTIGLQIAIKALELRGEVITTPFSYVATTSSLVWQNCIPVFADIDPSTLNIDPEEILRLITPRTTGILATHCFGNPCDIEAISSIAKQFNLKVIYDAAHCFGTKYDQKSVLSYGDASVISFHATKIFHTIEGGAIISSDMNFMDRVRYMRNFGHNGPERFFGVGINGKNSEVHSAMGLVVLKHFDSIFKRRKSQCEYYDMHFKGMNLVRPFISERALYNNAYYAILFENEELTLRVKDNLEKNEIFPRRYFYPSLSKLDYTHQTGIETPISDDVCSRILCLPLYHELNFQDQDLVIEGVKQILLT